MTRYDRETTRSQRKPQVKCLPKMLSQGSKEKSHELRQEPEDTERELSPFFRSLRTSISPGYVLESTIRRNLPENATIRSRSDEGREREYFDMVLSVPVGSVFRGVGLIVRYGLDLEALNSV